MYVRWVLDVRFEALGAGTSGVWEMAWGGGVEHSGGGGARRCEAQNGPGNSNMCLHAGVLCMRELVRGTVL